MALLVFLGRLEYQLPVLAYVVAVVELVGGIAMILGVFAEWAGVLLAIVMVGAIYFVKFSNGFAGGYEFDLVLLLGALAVLVTGPGRYTIVCLVRRGGGTQ